MKYEDPACAYCLENVRACRVGESAKRGPGYCPTKVDPDGIDEAAGKYDDAEVRRISQVSAVVEAAGYCKWTRVQENWHRHLHQFCRSRQSPERHPRESRVRGGLCRLQARWHPEGGTWHQGRGEDPPWQL